MSSPGGSRAKPRPHRGLPLFLALTIASPDTIMLLIVDYDAAIGGGDTARGAVLAYAPGYVPPAHRHVSTET